MSGSRQNSVEMGEVVYDRQSLATPDSATWPDP